MCDISWQLKPLAAAQIASLADAEFRRKLASAERIFEARHSENTPVVYARGCEVYTAWCRSRALDGVPVPFLQRVPGPIESWGQAAARTEVGYRQCASFIVPCAR